MPLVSQLAYGIAVGAHMQHRKAHHLIRTLLKGEDEQTILRFRAHSRNNAPKGSLHFAIYRPGRKDPNSGFHWIKLASSHACMNVGRILLPELW